LHRSCDAPKNILQCIAYGEDKVKCYLLTQLLVGGELFERMTTKDPKYKTTEKLAIQYVHDMLQAVKYCHDNNIVHRDIKPDNFVFENKAPESNLILIDFGTARIGKDDDIINGVVGTEDYLAPEVAGFWLKQYYKKQNRKPPTKLPEIQQTFQTWKASDVWSIGVIIYAAMTGKVPFFGITTVQICEAICTQSVVFGDDNELELKEPFKDFIRKILEKDPLKRMSIEDAIAHPWLQTYDDGDDYNVNKRKRKYSFKKVKVPPIIIPPNEPTINLYENDMVEVMSSSVRQ